MPDTHYPRLPHKSYAHILTGEVQGKYAGHSEIIFSNERRELPSITDTALGLHRSLL